MSSLLWSWPNGSSAFLFDEPSFASLLSILAIPRRSNIHDDTAAPYVVRL